MATTHDSRVKWVLDQAQLRNILRSAVQQAVTAVQERGVRISAPSAPEVRATVTAQIPHFPTEASEKIVDSLLCIGPPPRTDEKTIAVGPEHGAPLFSFAEALMRMRRGKSVRRRKWSSSWSIRLKGEEIFSEMDNRQHQFNSESVLALDWEEKQESLFVSTPDGIAPRAFVEAQAAASASPVPVGVLPVPRAAALAMLRTIVERTTHDTPCAVLGVLIERKRGCWWMIGDEQHGNLTHDDLALRWLHAIEEEMRKKT